MENFYHFDRNKTLEELEGVNWGKPDYNSHLVTTCYKLRKKPLINFEIEDLRIMIGQSISLDFLVPLALEILDDKIIHEGDFYNGDLLNSLLKVDKSYWEKNHIYKSNLENIIKKTNIESRGFNMFNQDNELFKIITKFAESGWDVIDAPSKAWLDANTNGVISDNVSAELIAAVEKADIECGSCGCEFDPLYKKALVLLKDI